MRDQKDLAFSLFWAVVFPLTVWYVNINRLYDGRIFNMSIWEALAYIGVPIIVAVIGVFIAGAKINGAIQESKTALSKDLKAQSKEHGALSKEHTGLRERILEILHVSRELQSFAIQEKTRRELVSVELDPMKVVDQVTALATENGRLTSEVERLSTQLNDMKLENARLTERINVPRQNRDEADR